MFCLFDFIQIVSNWTAPLLSHKSTHISSCSFWCGSLKSAKAQKELRCKSTCFSSFHSLQLNIDNLLFLFPCISLFPFFFCSQSVNSIQHILLQTVKCNIHHKRVTSIAGGWGVPVLLGNSFGHSVHGWLFSNAGFISTREIRFFGVCLKVRRGLWASGKKATD